MSHFATKKSLAKTLFFTLSVSSLILYQNCSRGFGISEQASENLPVVASPQQDPASNEPSPMPSLNNILSAGNSLVAAAAPVSLAENTLVFILAGQSNMEGYADASQIRPEEKVIPSNVTYYIGSQKQQFYGASGKFGPEIGIAYILATKFPNHKIVLIKSALGGTSQRRWAINAQDNSGMVISGSGDLFMRLRNSVTEVINRDYAGQTLNLSGFFWMQGESDADEYQQIGQMYSSNMQKFFSQVQNQLRLSADFKFVMGRIFQYRTSNMIDRGVSFEFLKWIEDFIRIRRAQTQLSTPFNFRLISTDELTLHDFWHFDAWSTLSLGKCFAEAYLVSQRTLGCSKTTGIHPAFSADDYTDDRITGIRAAVTDLYRRIFKREPDDEGLRYWVAEVYKGKPLADVEQFMLNTIPSCAAQGLASAINGQCHFNFSCVSQSEAAAEISRRKASYGSCANAAPTSHPDCMNAYGAARGYLAACPLMKSNETLATDGSTLTGRVADLFKIYRKRNPDVDGLNYWVRQIETGASSEQALKEALQK